MLSMGSNTFLFRGVFRFFLMGGGPDYNLYLEGGGSLAPIGALIPPDKDSLNS